MKLTTDGWAQRPVRWWVSLYTWGLPSDLRARRRAEIESDLWEQRQNATDTGRTNWATTTEMFIRWFMGIPADLHWRLDLIMASRYVSPVKSEPHEQTFIGIAGLMAAFTVILFIAVSLGMFESHVVGLDVPRFMWGIVGPSAGAIIAAGLAVGRRLPMLGGASVIAGAFPIAAILVWTIFVPALWLLLVTFFLMRVLRFGWWNQTISL